ncbi:hypothetical protein A2127_01005 [Candidatus Jorgensenbacteria bacterium GWC1_48_12]|uniref:EamA domain-containing protein n=1 Tax=Candidatus Jorgensenbacteria bacterium GWC1_48_12 TaxID=1798469 RepID=A0A1F6BM04_9BACT|nr:MAG: hypothetical protein A2127_01005 [Candidatus Jorgensenbacteria bacterium GWC1_48_12]
MNLLSINYIIWLILSGIFFAIGEFLSKKFTINPSVTSVVIILLVYSVGVLCWLPAMLQKNQLSITGVMWSVLSLLTTVMIGVLLFGEKLNFIGTMGIITAFISIVLLSLK